MAFTAKANTAFQVGHFEHSHQPVAVFDGAASWTASVTFAGQVITRNHQKKAKAIDLVYEEMFNIKPFEYVPVGAAKSNFRDKGGKIEYRITETSSDVSADITFTLDGNVKTLSVSKLANTSLVLAAAKKFIKENY